MSKRGRDIYNNCKPYYEISWDAPESIDLLYEYFWQVRETDVHQYVIDKLEIPHFRSTTPAVYIVFDRKLCEF